MQNHAIAAYEHLFSDIASSLSIETPFPRRAALPEEEIFVLRSFQELKEPLKVGYTVTFDSDSFKGSEEILVAPTVTINGHTRALPDVSG